MNPQRPPVLVVDDNERSLRAMSAVLSPLGVEGMPVRSGPEALKALREEDFALILLSVEPPGTDGLQIAQTVRARGGSEFIPIIGYSCEELEPRLVARAYQSGAIDSLAALGAPDVLKARVRFFAEHWRSRVRCPAEIARARAAEKAVARRGEFDRRLLASVSHDLRSPLAAVSLTATMLLKEVEDPVLVRSLERIVRSTRRMDQLTGLLLDVSRAQSGNVLELKAEPADMRDLCRGAIEELHAAHPDRTIELTFDDGDGSGVWEPIRIQQVVSNLVTNALKYGDPSSPVIVHVNLTGPVVQLSVHNEGEPIDPDTAAVMFEPFTRSGEDHGLVRHSVGLGLYIVREIADAHGGSVTVESTRDKGTTFRVALPRFAPASRAASEAPSANQARG